MPTPSITPLYSHRHSLGEGAFWHAETEQLWWVDILEKQIYNSDPEGHKLRQWAMPELVGFVLPRPDGRFWVGLQSGLHIADLSEQGNARLERVDRLEHPEGEVRFNDAGLGPQGSLYASTMAMDAKSVLGTVMQYDFDGNRTIVAEGFVIGNGPLWHPEVGLLMVETEGHPNRPKGIYARHPATSDQAETTWHQWPWDSSPDGISVDARGNVWVGGYGGHTIRQFSPAGQLLQSIDLPALNPTKIAALPDGQLFVTTANTGVSDEQRGQYPMTGQVLMIRL